MNMPPRIESIGIMLIVALIGVGYFATIRGGQDWGDDFAQYLLHARNLAEGRPYQDTGYLYNPSAPVIGPTTYPPVFPLLLAPLYQWGGLDLALFKRALVAIFLGWLFLFAATFRHAMPFPQFAATLLLIGANPFFWDFKDRVLSDIPFLLFTYLALLLIERFHAPRTFTAIHYGHALAAGLVIGLAYGTRTIGIVLLPCLLLHEIIQWRRATRFSGIAAAAFVLCWGAQRYFFHDNSGYIAQLTCDLRIMVYNAFWFYPRHLSLLWENGYSRALRWIVGLLMCGWFLAGWREALKKQVTAFDLFFALYLVPIVIWPSTQGTRFLIPIIPLFMLHAVRGLDRVARRHARPLLITGLMFALLAGSYVAKYSTVTLGTIADGIADAETQALFAFVSQSTHPADVFVFFKPRAFALFTGRQASAYHITREDREFLAYLRQIAATHIIVSGNDEAWWREFPARHAENVALLYANSDFRVYRLLETPHAPEYFLDKSSILVQSSAS